MSENRNTRVPIIAAFLAGIAVAAIVAFIIFGQRDASARKNAAEPESNTKQETQCPSLTGASPSGNHAGSCCSGNFAVI